ncbi:MAG TPA: HAMP domain-containing histidine kinase [Candidatus Lachnoclostridium stercoravium]|uniref:histidine kinase n=1 Tax=Candidatus Lachnoclostridium stercoravium TaxID=2838633 RepID=A0A9D2HEV2_9FIRM|nr:HAMP domain-containing histidine kinase [Candidatus Lachnoclostridium stercoravium]
MHLHSLYYKFIIGYLIFGLLGFITIATFSSHITYRQLQREQADALYDEANLIAGRYSGPYQGQTPTELSAAYPQLNAIASFLQADIWVVNRRGNIILDSNDSLRAGQLIEDFDPTATGNKSYSIGNYYGMFNYDVLSVSAPITGNYNTYGYVLIHMPLSVIYAGHNTILNLIYITALILFGLSLIILLVFAKTVYIPLKKITAGANEYAAGNLTYQIKVDSQDEMGYLAATLNYMSDELNKMEEYQRTFVANVSHDFRSPLTSIKGYLEAIIDGTIPREMQDKYLKRVINETERLNKLTQGMLTLNSLDSKGYLSRSNFDINRVIKDTAASFEGTCGAKGITFELTFSDNIQMVYADLGKIQQVLYNLIDNAIKFSHHDSTIFIQTSVRHEKVFVSVKDTGIGIPKDNIKKIWERFYKSDASRGKDKKGTGLGLAIVKEIIQAHGENIDVISTEGVGTEFIFSLPKPTAL